jgi:phenylpyruvate tautomerase PptA (4-oxalocrotonate tautomerase family)
MISKVESAPTIEEKLALIERMTSKHREALQLLNDLRISLIIEQSRKDVKDSQ